jgi:hypothetical protein
LAHAFRWEHSDEGLQLAQLLGRLGACLTLEQLHWLEPTQGRWTSVLQSASSLDLGTCEIIRSSQTQQTQAGSRGMLPPVAMFAPSHLGPGQGSEPKET